MSSVIDFVSESLKRNPLPRQALREELPTGWKKIESRTKPGTYYYAHPATNRTQVQPPSGTKQVPANGADQKSADKVQEDEARKSAQLAAEKDQERKRKYQEVEEEAEAEEELVEEEKRRIKAAKKAKELEQKRKQEEAARLEKERKELEAKREKERLQREAEERKRQQELEALAEERRKKEAEVRKKEQEAQRRKAMVFEQHSILQRKLAEDARKKQEQEEEEKKKKASEEKVQEQRTEADEAERKAKAEKLDAKIWNQKIPDMMEPTSSPCFEVYKSGKHQRTHALGGDKSSWIIGRGPAGVDIAIGNPRISRKHAEVTSQGPLLFLNDLGSTYGTAMNKEKLEAKSPVELVNGARFRFGGLPELYVYREPVEEEEEPSSPPVEAEVTGTALAEDAPDLPPPAPAPEPVAPQIDAEAAAAAAAKAAEEAEAEDEARIKRIQQKRQERKAAEAAEKALVAAKKEEERKKKQDRNLKKRAAKEAKAAKKAQASRPKPGTEQAELPPGDATPPDVPLPESCMASPPEEEPDDLPDVHLGRSQDADGAEAKSIDFF